LPWESIGEAGDTVGNIDLSTAVADERQLPLTPWARQDIAPDSTSMEADSGPSLSSEPTDEETDDSFRMPREGHGRP